MNRRSLMKLPLALAAPLIFPRIANAALVPPAFLNCVVALGFRGPGVVDGAPVASTWHTIGTGFFYGKLISKNESDIAKRKYAPFLVTAKHVVDGFEKTKLQMSAIGNMKVRINPVDEKTPGGEFDLNVDLAVKDFASWKPNPNGKDVSVIPVDLNGLRDRKYEYAFFASDEHSANREKLRQLGVSAGDGVFVLGFPMDLAGLQKNYVVVRQGAIARISELLDGASDNLLLDAFVFPGNSGGPVILRPEIVSIQGTKVNDKAYLIGLVNASVNYTDTATSIQTGRPRILFEENSGLTNVSPTDYIDDTIATFPVPEE